ncbi:MAG: hypothetical protein JXA41_15645 [Deltaproteobacteria bacterium]|nr:hypothetical protein [Deltaproteobacteria bacterium]
MNRSLLANRIMIWGAISILLIAGCSGGTEDSISNTTEESSTKTRVTTSILTPSVEQVVVSGINALGVDLFYSTSGNAVVAPFSASLALARLRAGAGGTTRTDLSEIMHIAGIGADTDAAYNALDLSISSLIDASTLDDQSSLAGASGWAQARYGFLISYLDTLAEYYGVWPMRADFALETSAASQAVRDWASEITNDLSVATGITQDTRFVLGEAVRFDIAWTDPFDPILTEKEWFTKLNGIAVEADFMRQTAQIPQTSGDGYCAFELPLQGDVRFLVILPDTGRYQEIAASVTPDSLDAIVSALTPALVDLAIPKFAINNFAPLNLGESSSKNVADYSGIDGTMELFVSSTVHRSKLSVSEAELQAGSVTLLTLDDVHPETWTDPHGAGCIGYCIDSCSNGWIIGGIVTMPPPPIISLGRPFLFVVRDSGTGVILFMGRVVSVQE